MLDDLHTQLKTLAAQAPPEGLDVPSPDARTARWVLPELVGEVAYAETTTAGTLRHPRWRGLRTDKTTADLAAF